MSILVTPTKQNKEPAYIKLEIGDEEIKILHKIFEILEGDPLAYDFLEPVDYVALNILDYPKIITHPMDLGTVKKNLHNNVYPTFKEFLDDINLIWTNCRTYNQSGSDIVKMANHCDKKIKQLIDKQFKNYQNKIASNKNKNENASLTLAEKTKLVETVREISNEGLTQIVKIILKDCPKGIEDIDSEKLQIKVDLLDKKTYDSINQYLEKNNSSSNDKPKSSKK